MENRNDLVLYQRENCPYCGMVRKKLSQLNLPVKLVPVEKDGADRQALFELSGQRAVPVLADGDKILPDSAAILNYLDETYGGGDTRPMPASDIGIDALMTGSFEAVVEKTTEELKKQGFGVQTEIDVQATLRKKLGVEVPRQIILGACNPGIAHQLLEAEPGIGLLLPCNVTIREIGENRFAISAVHPVKLLSLIGRDDLMPVAKEARDRLKAALTAINSD